MDTEQFYLGFIDNVFTMTDASFIKANNNRVRIVTYTGPVTLTVKYHDIKSLNWIEIKIIDGPTEYENLILKISVKDFSELLNDDKIIKQILSDNRVAFTTTFKFIKDDLLIYATLNR